MDVPLVRMMAKLLWAAKENVVEDLCKCGILGILLTCLSRRHVIQTNAITMFQEVLEGEMALMHAIYWMRLICA